MLLQDKNTTTQKLWDAAEAILGGKFIAIQAFLRNQQSQIDNLTYHLKELEKQWMLLQDKQIEKMTMEETIKPPLFLPYPLFN